MELTHFDENGKAHMVDVSHKDETSRIAVAKGKITMGIETLELIEKGQMGKGDVLGVAQVAGIMGAKKTSELIPMCHTLMLTGCSLKLYIDKENRCIFIEASVMNTGKTGVEMEALTAVSTAALTIYDMCKAVDKGITIEDIHLEEKHGGKSGSWYFKRSI